jgi:two-component system response regulator AtoC
VLTEERSAEEKTKMTGAEDKLEYQSDVEHSGREPDLTEEIAVTQTWYERLESSLGRIAESDVPVLIQGETGVGKEVVARSIHAKSPRRNAVFLKVNCAALPMELAESELFGYEKGAFTGAFQTNPGKFELADRGTILLDEIGDMDFRLQAKLLQVLQDQEYLPLGARKTRKVNVRLIAATHRDLQAMIAAGTFRSDLYYRLDVVKISVPSLRERKNEAVKLAHGLIRRHTPAGVPLAEITPALERAILAYDWPGNVRELENTIRRLVVYNTPDAIAEDLMRSMQARPDTGEAPAPMVETLIAESQTRKPSGTALDRLRQRREEEEAKILLDALTAEHWNRKKAAARLNLEYKAFLYRIKKLRVASNGLNCA